MRRNELANDILKALTDQQLPPVLQSLGICKGCRHLNFCTIYYKAYGGSMETSGLGHLFNACISHLTIGHYDFLRHWDRLIDLEAKDAEWGRKEIWRTRSARHNHITSSLSPIVLDTSIETCKKFKDGRFYYRFVRQDFPLFKSEAGLEGIPSASNSSSNDLACTLRRGDCVILMTKPDCQAIASGVISEISRSHVLVSFSKRPRLPQRSLFSKASNLIQEVWCIDKDEIMTPFAIMRGSKI